MMRKHCSVFFLLCSTPVLGFLIPKEPFHLAKEERLDLGDPLFLTPLIDNGRYDEARQLSKVKPDIGNTTSYSGYLTINKTCNSNTFFWFFPALKENWEKAPLLLWLNGGPGVSSQYGLFEELGPFSYEEDRLQKRKYSWNIENNLLIIDQPVGVGFSFTEGKCYAEDENRVGEDLYQAILQLYELFPNFQQTKFFISGESYAGHYIPALGHAIHKNNPSAKLKINLSAMLIGNGLYDAAKQSDYASYLYQLGLINDYQKEIMEDYQNHLLKAVEDDNLTESTWARVDILNLVSVFAGSQVSYYNYLAETSMAHKPWENFVNSISIRKALHVGDHKFRKINRDVYISLFNDVTKSMQPWIEELLEYYPIVFYNGQLDIICGYPMSINFIRSLNWSGQPQYLSATRFKWCVDKEQAGYYTGQHHLYDVLVRGAGHMVPADQPHWAYELVNSVTSGTPDNPLHALKTCDY